VEVQEVRGGDAIFTLRDEWDDLVTRCERATIFQTWEWNEAWWRTFHGGKRLRLLLFRQNGTLVGLAPFYISRHLGTPLRRLAFVGTGASDYLDVLAPDEYAPDVCAAVMRHLTSSRDFDLADLQQMRPTALLREAVERRLSAAPNVPHLSLTAQEVCPCAVLPSSWEEFRARLSANMRAHLSRRGRQAAKTFADLEMRRVEDADLSEAMTALFDLHQKRWNARLLPGVLGTKKVQTFHHRIAERLQRRGWLRLYLLRATGRFVAALYCFRFRERFYYYLGGFDPTLSRHSLGTILMAHAIREAIAEGCAVFDFLRGNEDYKYRWLPEAPMNHRLLLGHPRSLRSHALLRLNHLERYVERHAKAFAERRVKSRSS